MSDEVLSTMMRSTPLVSYIHQKESQLTEGEVLLTEPHLLLKSFLDVSNIRQNREALKIVCIAWLVGYGFCIE